MAPPLHPLVELLTSEDAAIRRQGRELARHLSPDELQSLARLLDRAPGAGRGTDVSLLRPNDKWQNIERNPGLAIARHLWLRRLVGPPERP